MVRWGVRHLSLPVSPLAAEVLVVKGGISLGHSLKPGGFMVESDCLSVISLVSRPAVGCSDLDGVVRDPVNAWEAARKPKVCFVRREANGLAHCLAKSISVEGDCFFLSRFYPVLSDVSV